MKNIKIGNKTYSNVDTIKAKNADNENELIEFKSDYVADIATSDEMTALLVADNVGKIYRFTGTTDDTYTNGDLYEVVSE